MSQKKGLIVCVLLSLLFFSNCDLDSSTSSTETDEGTGNGSTADSIVVSMDSIPTNLKPGDLWSFTGTIVSPHALTMESIKLDHSYLGGATPPDSLVSITVRYSETFSNSKKLVIGSLESGADIEVTLNFAADCIKMEYSVDFIFLGSFGYQRETVVVDVPNDIHQPQIQFNIPAITEPIVRGSSYTVAGTVVSDVPLAASPVFMSIRTENDGYVSHLDLLCNFGINNNYTDPRTEWIIGNTFTGAQYGCSIIPKETCIPGNYQLVIRVKDMSVLKNGFEEIYHRIPFTVQ